MRTDANFPVATDFHAHERMLDASDGSAGSKDRLVIHEGDSAHDSYHVLRKVLNLLRIEICTSSPLFKNILDVKDDAVALLGWAAFALSLFKQFEAAQAFHGLV